MTDSAACDVRITDDGPGVVLAYCRTCRRPVVRDSAFRWDYLRAVVEGHIREVRRA